MIGAALVLALLLTDRAGPAADERFSESISVTRYVVEVGVTDHAGRVAGELGPSDFTVEVSGIPASVESALWFGSDGEAGAPEQGRHLLIFLQSDFARNRARMLGHMTFVNSFAPSIVAMLRPHDEVAVVSFDSHLRVLSDFTNDGDRILAAVKRSLSIGAGEAVVEAASDGSLSTALETTKRSTDVEGALLDIAHALQKVNGEKVVILAGWGFGETLWRKGGGSGVTLPDAWGRAVKIFQDERVRIITVSADTGQLSYSLAMSSRSTGGAFVSSAAGFSTQSLAVIEGVLTGRYELVLSLPEALEPGTHDLMVTVEGGRHVVAPATIVVQSSKAAYSESIALLNAGLEAEALAALQQWIENDTPDSDSLRSHLDELARGEQWRSALAVALELERRHELDDTTTRELMQARAGVERADRLAAQERMTAARRDLLEGSRELAKEHLDEALRLFPDFAEALYERGMLLLAEGALESAAIDLERCLRLEPAGMHSTDVRALLKQIR